MSGNPEALSRLRGTSLRSLGGTLDSSLVMVPMDLDKEEVRILKVCFYSNSFNMGKNFKLVKCTVLTEIRVRGEARGPGIPARGQGGGAMRSQGRPHA